MRHISDWSDIYGEYGFVRVVRTLKGEGEAVFILDGKELSPLPAGRSITLALRPGKRELGVKGSKDKALLLELTAGQRILRVGDLAIKIVASSDPFMITNVPRLHEVKKAILEASKASGAPA